MLIDDPALHINAFGCPCQVAGVDIVGIHRRPSAEAAGMMGDAPTLQVLTATLPAGVTHGTAAAAGGYTYTVAKRFDSGTGTTTLTLRSA